MQNRSLNRAHFSYTPHPLRFYRPLRVARLFGVDPSTIWRWTKTGVLPPPTQLGPGIRGWTEDELKQVLEARRARAGDE